MARAGKIQVCPTCYTCTTGRGARTSAFAFDRIAAIGRATPADTTGVYDCGELWQGRCGVRGAWWLHLAWTLLLCRLRYDAGMGMLLEGSSSDGYGFDTGPAYASTEGLTWRQCLIPLLR